MFFIEQSHPMLEEENKLWDDCFSFVAGIDEVGRGPLAGPVVAAAVIFTDRNKIPSVNDSKKLSHKKRVELRNYLISENSVKYSISVIEHSVIDSINILQATHKAMRECITKLQISEFALIDGLPVPNFPIKSKSIIKGDSKSASIAAASIIAKVYRDEIMDKYAEKYPEYGFEKHKGYGTALHIKAIKEYGILPIHRKTFEPVKGLINGGS